MCVSVICVFHKWTERTSGFIMCLSQKQTFHYVQLLILPPVSASWWSFHICLGCTTPTHSATASYIGFILCRPLFWVRRYRLMKSMLWFPHFTGGTMRQWEIKSLSQSCNLQLADHTQIKAACLQSPFFFTSITPWNILVVDLEIITLVHDIYFH